MSEIKNYYYYYYYYKHGRRLSLQLQTKPAITTALPVLASCTLIACYFAVVLF